MVLWRGHFNATESTKSVNLSINGGEGGPIVIIWCCDNGIPIASISFRCNCLGERRFPEHVLRKVSNDRCYRLCVALTSVISSTNNRFILEETDDKFYFPPGSLLYGQDNVVTILQVSARILAITISANIKSRIIWVSTSRAVSRMSISYHSDSDAHGDFSCY